MTATKVARNRGGRSKRVLSEQQAQEVRFLRSRGRTFKALAMQFGVSVGTIQRAAYGIGIADEKNVLPIGRWRSE